MEVENEYLEIDEIGNLIDNIEMVAHFLESSMEYKWKWVIIALYQALYSAFICVLSGTDPRQTVIDRNRDTGKAVMLHVNRVPIDIIASSFSKDEDTIREWLTNPYLIGFDEALRRVKRKESLPALTNAKPLTTTSDENDAIHALSKEFRNEFEHFAPKGWLISKSVFPPILRHTMRVIRFLVQESNCIVLSDEQKKRIAIALNDVDNIVSFEDT